MVFIPNLKLFYRFLIHLLTSSMASECCKALPDSGIIIPGSSDCILKSKIVSSGWPGTIEYLRLLLALPVATGFL